MPDDICPYVFCPKCKNYKSWVRDETKDVTSQETNEILWKGWSCRYCGEIALEPAKRITNGITQNV